MKRSSYRMVVTVSVVGLLSLAGGVFWQCQNLEQDILARQGDLTRLKQELENVKNISASQIELDKLTINELTATQLDILKHLGLEKSNLEFLTVGREESQIMGTALVSHNVRISGMLPYGATLALLDHMQNARKIIFTSVVVHPSSAKADQAAAMGDGVEFEVTGKLYGLSKQISTQRGGS